MIGIQTLWSSGTVSVSDGRTTVVIHVVPDDVLRAWRNGSGPPPNVNRFADELAALLDAHGIPRYAVSVLT